MAIIFLLSTVPPIFISPPKSLNKTEGDTATFSCNIQSEPIHTTKWYFKGELLNSTNSKYIITGQQTSYNTLTVNNITFSDTGEYTCAATNEHGTNNGTAYLTIQGNLLLVTLK